MAASLPLPKEMMMQYPHLLKSTTRNTQRGDFLIESLIGVLLIGLVGAGITATASRVSVSQGELQIQNQEITALQKIAIKGDHGQLCMGSNTTAISNKAGDCVVQTNSDGTTKKILPQFEIALGGGTNPKKTFSTPKITTLSKTITFNSDTGTPKTPLEISVGHTPSTTQ